MNLYSIQHYIRFYWQAVTKYQLHSPAIFSLVMDVLEDTKRYYAFDDIPTLCRTLLWQYTFSEDVGQQLIRKGIHLHAPERQTGERLFRLVRHFAPDRILMIGSGASIGCLYAAAAGQSALDIWEAVQIFEPITLKNMELQGYSKHSRIHNKEKVPISKATKNDLVICFSDYNFEDAQEWNSLFSETPKAWVVLNMYASPERFDLLNNCKQFPNVRASVDFFDFTVLLPDERMREVQHLKVVSAWQKLWKFY